MADHDLMETLFMYEWFANRNGGEEQCLPISGAGKKHHIMKHMTIIAPNI